MKTLSEREYFKILNRTLDEIFEVSTEIMDWNWSQLAEEAGLCVSTVYKLGNRETKFPRFFTVLKLATAVGWEMKLQKIRHHLKAKAG